METKAELTFLIQILEEDPQSVAMTPVLSGTPLPQLIALFEKEKAFEPSGGYAGIVPKNLRYGPLDRYFMGLSDDPLFAKDLYLLGCTCGEVGCWPLRGRISKRGNIMVWDSFRQPHRPQRDYSEFGPFVFEVEPYERAVRDAAASFGSG